MTEFEKKKHIIVSGSNQCYEEKLQAREWWRNASLEGLSEKSSEEESFKERSEGNEKKQIIKYQKEECPRQRKPQGRGWDMLRELKNSLENGERSPVNEVESRNKVSEVSRCQITQCPVSHEIILGFILKMVGDF